MHRIGPHFVPGYRPLVLVNPPHLQTGTGWVQIADVHGIPVPQVRRIQSRAVVIHTHGAVDDLVFAVAIDVRHGQVVVALSRILLQSGFSGIEDPT